MLYISKTIGVIRHIKMKISKERKNSFKNSLKKRFLAHDCSCYILAIINIRRLRRRIHALNNRTILHLLNVKQYSSPGAYAPRALRAPRRLVYKMTKHVFEAFCNFTKWKNMFSKLFRDYKKKNTFLKPFSAFSISWKTKTTSFWSAFHVNKSKNKFWKRFLSLQMKKARL